MTQTLVPTVPTSMVLDDAVLVFAEAWPGVTPVPITAPALAVTIAHCALESGNFNAPRPGEDPNHHVERCFNNNWGNTRAAKGETCDVCQFRCNEIENGKVVWYDPPAPQSTFRSFEKPFDGALAQLLFLARRTRYAQAWLRLLAGDPAGYVQCLKRAGYFTGAEGPYTTTVVSICRKVTPIAARVIAGAHTGITDADRDHVHELVGTSLAGLAGALRVPPDEQQEEFPLV